MTDNKNYPVERRSALWLRGMVAAIPIVLGYLPVGFAYGVLGQGAGLSTVNVILMSLVVFAGSAQLVAVGLISAGLSPLSIILTTFIVNLRHLLFSAAIFPHLAHWRKRDLAVFAYELTDETFALHSTRFELQDVKKGEVLAINITAHLAWIFGSWLGVVASKLVLDVEPLALDYVLPAMFIALLVMQIKSQSQVWAALLAGITSVVLLLSGFNQLHVIMATIFGASLGAWIERWKKI